MLHMRTVDRVIHRIDSSPDVVTATVIESDMHHKISLRCINTRRSLSFVMCRFPAFVGRRLPSLGLEVSLAIRYDSSNPVLPQPHEDNIDCR
jgi:hypothetical protein